MGKNTKIEWAHHTANIWWGCVEVSSLCDNCYARDWAKRYDRAKWGTDEPRLSIKGVWNDLKKFQKAAHVAGEIHRVFVGSMMDIFEKPMPFIDSKGERIEGITTHDLRMGFFNEVVPASPNLQFLLLTKRPGNIAKYIPADWQDGAPGNVLFGTSVGTQDGFNQAVPLLKQAPGRRFLSMEPVLEAVEVGNLEGIDWTIAGGESGPRARPSHPDWFRSIRDRCNAAKVPFLFKQWGEFRPYDNRIDPIGKTNGDLPDKFIRLIRLSANGVDVSHEYSDWKQGDELLFRAGKKAAGRMLDGRTWDEFPETKVLVAS